MYNHPRGYRKTIELPFIESVNSAAKNSTEQFCVTTLIRKHLFLSHNQYVKDAVLNIKREKVRFFMYSDRESV